MCKFNDQLMIYVNERNRWIERSTEDIPVHIQVEHIREGTFLPVTFMVRVIRKPLRVGISHWLIFDWIMGYDIFMSA